jgi:hypothetical protein
MERFRKWAEERTAKMLAESGQFPAGTTWDQMKAHVPRGQLRNFVIPLLAMFIAFPYLVRAIDRPWTAHLFGAVLVGEWYGEIVLADGRHVPIVFDIEAPSRPRKRRSDDDDIRGSARSCTGIPEVPTALFRGQTHTWSGTRFYLTPWEPESEWTTLPLRRIEGTWSNETVRMSTNVESREVTFTLTRGVRRDFRAACDRVRAQRAGENV